MKFPHALIALVLIGFFACARGEPTTPSEALSPGYLTCPKISDLHKDSHHMIWSAKNGWPSYSDSFATHVDKFLGAQWQGVNLGNVTCIYASNEKMTFPIILEYNLLVYQPIGGKWSKNLGGYANCRSDDPKECAFKPEAKPKSGDLYQQASQLKSTSQQEIGF